MKRLTLRLLGYALTLTVRRPSRYMGRGGDCWECGEPWKSHERLECPIGEEG